jgi:predicted MFS family arabinose efflux permease
LNIKTAFQLYLSGFKGLSRITWVISITLFLNRMGAMVLMFSTLYFTQELSFTKAEAGSIMAFFGIGSILGSYIGGWLADKYEPKLLMMIALVLSGGIVLLLPLTTNKIYLCAILFLYALVADSFRPPSSVAIKASSTEATRTRSISLMRFAINLGFTLGPAVGGLLAHKFGYKLLYTIDGVTSFLAALFLYFLYNAKTIKGNTVQTQLPITEVKDKGTSAYKNYKFLAFIRCVGFYGTLFFQLFASVPNYFKEVTNYSANTIGLLLALNGLFVAICEIPFVKWLEGQQIKKHQLVAIGCWCISIALLVLLLSPFSLLFAIVYTVVMTFSEIFAMPFMMSYALSNATKGRTGQYSALYSIGYGVSLIVAPSIGLWSAQQFGFTSTYSCFAVLAIILGFVLNKLMR